MRKISDEHHVVTYPHIHATTAMDAITAVTMHAPASAKAQHADAAEPVQCPLPLSFLYLSQARRLIQPRPPW